MYDSPYVCGPLCRNPSFGYFISSFSWPHKFLAPFELCFQPFQPDDSNSKVPSNAEDILWTCFGYGCMFGVHAVGG